MYRIKTFIKKSPEDKWHKAEFLVRDAIFKSPEDYMLEHAKLGIQFYFFTWDHLYDDTKEGVEK